MIVKSLEHLKLYSIQIAEKLSKSDNILLKGEIGTGKTTFTRYLINYLQQKEKTALEEVLSPTFNLLYEYQLKNYKIMYYDLYRLKNKKEIDSLGIFYENEQVVKIIEWPELIKENITDKLELTFNHNTELNERNLNIPGYGKWKNFKIDEI